MSVSATSKLPLAIGLLAIVIGGAALAQAYSLNSQLANLSTSVSETSAKAADISKQVQALSKQVGPKTQKLRIEMAEGDIIGPYVERGRQLTGNVFYRWEPVTFVVKQGDTIELTIVNPRRTTHSFVLSAFNVDTGPIPGRMEQPDVAKRTIIVKFVADKTGVFKFECGTLFDEAKLDCTPDHKKQVGYLIVLE